MTSATITTHHLAERGASYTELIGLLERQKASLHPSERQVFSDAADALLFDEPDRQERVEQAESLLSQLTEAERWTSESADKARGLLQLIASSDA